MNFKLCGVCPPCFLVAEIATTSPPEVTRHGAHVQNLNETTWKKSTSTIILCTILFDYYSTYWENVHVQLSYVL